MLVPGVAGSTAQPPADMLIVENLRVAFPTRTGLVDAVRGVSLGVGREKLGIVGESGSGKSTVGRAVMRLLPAAGAGHRRSARLRGHRPAAPPAGRNGASCVAAASAWSCRTRNTRSTR